MVAVGVKRALVLIAEELYFKSSKRRLEGGWVRVEWVVDSVGWIILPVGDKEVGETRAGLSHYSGV